MGCGDEDVSTSLPLLHREGGGDFGQEIGVGGEDTGLAVADETGEFRSAAVFEWIAGTEFANQLAYGCAASPGEEISGSSGSVF